MSSWTPRESILATLATFNAFVAIVAVSALMNSDRGADASMALLRGVPPLTVPPLSYHTLYSTALADAKYIDLTLTIEPGMSIWPGFAAPTFGPTEAVVNQPPFVNLDEPFSYAKQGFIATQVMLATDQLGTQLDPPAHWNEYGATISDLPASITLRPLVVIDVSAKVAADPTYHAQVEDVLAWEAVNGGVPAGSVVFFRTVGWPDPAPSSGIGLATLQFLHRERAILLHGHEALDTDATPSLEGEAWLLHNDFMQAEGVANLHLVPSSGCLISIGFPKIAGGVGGYARYVAVCPPGSTPNGVSVAEAPGAPLPRHDAPLRRGADGVLAPSPGATPTVYCAPENSGSSGCPPVDWSEPPTVQ